MMIVPLRRQQEQAAAAAAQAELDAVRAKAAKQQEAKRQGETKYYAGCYAEAAELLVEALALLPETAEDWVRQRRMTEMSLSI
jgi:hypothetical protein